MPPTRQALAPRIQQLESTLKCFLLGLRYFPLFAFLVFFLCQESRWLEGSLLFLGVVFEKSF